MHTQTHLFVMIWCAIENIQTSNTKRVMYFHNASCTVDAIKNQDNKQTST